MECNGKDKCRKCMRCIDCCSCGRRRSHIMDCFQEVEDFFSCRAPCRRDDKCGPRYDFRWRFSAALNNLCLKMKGGRRG